MIFHWPQVTYLILIFLSLGYSLAKYGEQKNDKYNFGASLVITLLICTILYYGDFWTGTAP